MSLKKGCKISGALVILTNEGLIIITGCAHPGVVEIVKRAIRITNREVLLLAGGFHLLRDYGESLQETISKIKELGVRSVAPSHCTGGEAIKIFAEVYGDRYINSGVGRVITAGDLA